MDSIRRISEVAQPHLCATRSLLDGLILPIQTSALSTILTNYFSRIQNEKIAEAAEADFDLRALRLVHRLSR